MKNLGFILLSLFVMSCTQVHFDKPQPDGKKTLKTIPSKLHGVYIGVDDEVQDTLWVDALKFVNQEIFINKYALSDVDSYPNIEIKDNMLFNESFPTKEGTKFTVKNDTLYYRKAFRIPNFISDSIILKKYSKMYVVNVQDKHANRWDAYLIELKKGDTLKIYGVKDFLYSDRTKEVKLKEELKPYFKITKFHPSGKNEFIISPTAKEFKKLYQQDFFEVQRVFVKAGE